MVSGDENNALVEMWGCSSPEEIIGRQLAEFWEGPGIYRTMEDLTAKGWSMGEDIGKRKDGSLFPVDYKAIMCTDFDGKPLYVLGQFVDITAKKNAEQALRKSEEKFRLYFDNAPIGYQSLDENGNLIEVNRTWLKMLGYKREEVIDRWFGDFLHPDMVNLFKTPFPKNKETRGVMRDTEYMLRCKDGSYILS